MILDLRISLSRQQSIVIPWTRRKIIQANWLILEESPSSLLPIFSPFSPWSRQLVCPLRIRSWLSYSHWRRFRLDSSNLPVHREEYSLRQDTRNAIKILENFSQAQHRFLIFRRAETLYLILTHILLVKMQTGEVKRGGVSHLIRWLTTTVRLTSRNSGCAN